MDFGKKEKTPSGLQISGYPICEPLVVALQQRGANQRGDQSTFSGPTIGALVEDDGLWKKYSKGTLSLGRQPHFSQT